MDSHGAESGENLKQNKKPQNTNKTKQKTKQTTNSPVSWSGIRRKPKNSIDDFTFQTMDFIIVVNIPLFS
jgi:hypothetical protein